MNISAIRLLPILVIILCNVHGSYCIWSLFSDWVARNFPGTSYNGFTTAARVLGNITNRDVLERRDSNETELNRTPKPDKYLSTMPTIDVPFWLEDQRNHTSSVIAQNFTEETPTTLGTFFDEFESMFVDKSNGTRSEDVSNDLPTTRTSFEDGRKFTSTISSTTLRDFEERVTTLPIPINAYEESKDIATTMFSLTYEDTGNDDSIRISMGTRYNSEESSTNPSKLSDMESTSQPSSYRTPIPTTNDSNWSIDHFEQPSNPTTSSTIPILIELVNVSSLAAWNASTLYNFPENVSDTDITFLPDETEVFGDNTTTTIYEDYALSTVGEKRTDFVIQMVDNGSDLYQQSHATLQTESTITTITPLNESYLHSTSTDKPSEAITKTIAYVTELYTTISPSTTARAQTEDPWLGYFDVVRSNDVKNCLSLMVCETSAEPNMYQDYGKRISNFFQKYIPREDNRAGWWYKNAALMGMESQSVQSCKSNFPFCDIDTRHIFMLMEVPEYKK